MNIITKKIRIIPIIFAVLLLTSCGGGGSSAPAASTPTAASAVNMAISGKSLDFTWTQGTNVDHYRISVNPDGASGFTVDPAANNIVNTSTSHSIEVPVHKINWLAAQYIVEACNADESNCIASPNQTLALIDSVAATINVKASNTGVNDSFGTSLAMSADGSTLAVGAPSESSNATGINGNQVDNTATGAGAVYVFSRTGSTWAQQAYVKASNAEAGDNFGSSIALSADGSTLAVGAQLESSIATGVGGIQTDNTAVSAGAAYVFTRTGSTWLQQAYLKASNAEAGDQFGYSIVLSADGSTLAVGAFGEDSITTGINGNQADNTAAAAGAVYVFSRIGVTWSQQAYVKASNTEAGDLFGNSVALSTDGNTLAAGSISEDSITTGINGNQADNTAAAAGAVYVFSRIGVTWSQQAYVKASNSGASDLFGNSVALSADGSTLAVGADGESSITTGINGNQTDNTTSWAGAVYVFTRTGSTWSQQAYVKASNTGRNDDFGSSVALSADGNTLAVGASGESSITTGINGNQADNTIGWVGAVYVFTRTGNTWSQQAYVKASNSGALDYFGSSISLSADSNTLAIGAPGEASAEIGVGKSLLDNVAFGAGAVYLY